MPKTPGEKKRVNSVGAAHVVRVFIGLDGAAVLRSVREKRPAGGEKLVVRRLLRWLCCENVLL